MHLQPLILELALLGALWSPSQAADTGIVVQYRDKPQVVLIGAQARMALTSREMKAAMPDDDTIDAPTPCSLTVPS